MSIPPKRSSWITRATTGRADRIEIEVVDDESVFQDLDSPFSIAKETEAPGHDHDSPQASVEKIVAELATLLGPGKVSVRGKDLEDHAADKWYARQLPDIGQHSSHLALEFVVIDGEVTVRVPENQVV